MWPRSQHLIMGLPWGILMHNHVTYLCVLAVSAAGHHQSHSEVRGVATGGISVYIPPKSVNLTNFYVVTGCFFLAQDKLNIVPVCALARVFFTYLHTTIYTPPPNEIPGYAPVWGVWSSPGPGHVLASTTLLCISAVCSLATNYHKIFNYQTTFKCQLKSHLFSTSMLVAVVCHIYKHQCHCDC